MVFHVYPVHIYPKNMTNCKEIDAQIAKKTLRLELEQLKDKKMNEDEANTRVANQKEQFQKIFDQQKSDMTIELLYGDGVLENPAIMIIMPSTGSDFFFGVQGYGLGIGVF